LTKSRDDPRNQPIHFPSWQPELTAALAVAERAAELARRLYEGFVAIPDAPAHVSTAADRQIQDLLLEGLSASFPHDAYCAEEDTPTLARLPRRGPRRWIIDPIDGTRGFARKKGEFCIMIALTLDDRPALGVVAEPLTGNVTYAVRGQGCWTGASETVQRCSVTVTERIEEATLLLSHDSKTHPDSRLERAARAIRSYSAGLKLAMIARGEADLYWRRHLFHSWDICAGQILVEEAGGVVTDAQGQPIDYGRLKDEAIPGIRASNGRLALA
jgi:3'(2'), 5'-bisphosphate nucleotidase